MLAMATGRFLRRRRLRVCVCCLVFTTTTTDPYSVEQFEPLQTVRNQSEAKKCFQSKIGNIFPSYVTSYF